MVLYIRVYTTVHSASASKRSDSLLTQHYRSSYTMAGQVVSTNALEVLRISSYIRGYHAYMDVWTPVQDEMLILKREPTNVALTEML